MLSKVFITLLALCLAHSPEIYYKLKCTNKPSDAKCFDEVQDGSNSGYIATQTYSPSTIEGAYVSFRQFCKITTNQSNPAHPAEGALAARLLNGHACIFDDDCYSTHCIRSTSKCGDLIKNDFTNCDENNDCADGLICLAHRCTFAKKVGESCYNVGDSMCVVGAECINDVCRAIGSIAVGQKSDAEELCVTQYMDSTNICRERANLHSLDFDSGKNYKVCKLYSDCTYNGVPSNNVYACQFPTYSPDTSGTPVKYCVYGGGEKIIIDAVSKYIADLKYGDMTLNAINRAMFNLEKKIDYIEPIACSNQAFEAKYTAKSATPFPWLMVILVSLAIIPLLIIPIALLCK
jgi:hypothetical protein